MISTSENNQNQQHPSPLNQSINNNNNNNKLETSLKGSKNAHPVGILSWLTTTHLSSFTSDLFRPLTDMDGDARQLALKDILPQLYNSLRSQNKELVKIYAARIVRHATECPFEDVSLAFHEFLLTVEKVCCKIEQEKK